MQILAKKTVLQKTAIPGVMTARQKQTKITSSAKTTVPGMFTKIAVIAVNATNTCFAAPAINAVITFLTVNNPFAIKTVITYITC